MPVLVRPEGALLPGVDDEAAWPAHGADELRWSFGCDLAEAFAGLVPSLTAPAEGDQEQFLADLEALDRAEMAAARPAASAANPSADGRGAGPGAANPSAGDRGAGPGTAPSVGDRGAAPGGANPSAGAAASGDGDAGPDASGPGAGGAGAGGADSGATLGLLGLIADALPASPGLAAWAAQLPADQLSDVDLPAVAAALRRVTSWAQATELSVVAQIAARSAARHPDAGLEDDGRPAVITRDATAQAGLALTLSPGAAAWWTDLATTLTWRLPAVHAALAAGQIDLTRARIITDATAVLSDEDARAVADQILAGAAGQTYGQLRAAVARAVILADPQGAEERRQATERRARVGLYPGDHHTATLTGMNLPAVHAAAAMARLTAIARALQAAGAGGGLDLLRAHAYLGLLLNTLPPIPPRPDAPPDHDPGEDDPGPGDPGPGDLGEGGPDGSAPGDPGPGGPGGPGGRGGPGLDGNDPGEAGPSDSDQDDGGAAGPAPGGAGRPGASPRGRSRRRRPGNPGTPPRPGGSRTGDGRSTSGQAGPDSTSGRARQDHLPPDRPGSAGATGSATDHHRGAGGDHPPGPPGPRPAARDPAGPGRHPGGPSPGPPDPHQPTDPPDRSDLTGTPDRLDRPGPPDASSTTSPPDSGHTQPPGTHDAAVAQARSDRLPPECWPGDADAPADDGVREPPLDVPEGYADDGGYPDYDLFDEPDDPNPIPAWPGLPATTPAPGLGLAPAGAASPASAPGLAAPGTGPAAGQNTGLPARGLLELTMAWSALAHRSASPAILSRIGPVTAEQARLLAAVAASTPATRWRVILTDTHGHALAVTTIPRHATRPPRQTRPHPTHTATPLTGRITITVPITALDAPLPISGHPLLGAIATAAARALLRLQHETGTSPSALSRTHPADPDPADPGHAHPADAHPADPAPADPGQADPAQANPSPTHPDQPAATASTATGGCDHHDATSGYRPTTAIRDYITARDQTCRYPHCRQPAWHADLDHTRPYHKGGRTCPCNLGALCRTHHILKQLQGWTLTQPRPGTFQWTTPTGRTYICEPDIHPS